MTVTAELLIGLLVYLLVGIVLKNHTKIGTIQFKNFSTRFIIFWILPLGGVVFYMISNLIYVLAMVVSELIFGDRTVGPGKFFPDSNWPEYPRE